MSVALFIQGLGLGLSVAVPLGPINVEIIRRGLMRGFRPAVLLGLGACTVDMAYLSLVLLGVTHWAQGAMVRSVMLAAAGLLLLALGTLTAWSTRKIARTPLPTEPPADRRGGLSLTPLGSYVTGILMTAGNPMNIAFWMGVSPSLSRGSFARSTYLPSLAGIALATSGWVLTLSLLCAAGRRWLQPWVLITINLGGAVLLWSFGAGLLWMAWNGLP
jgi:threonine/homoserine/homoserine lactone efflux protein